MSHKEAPFLSLDIDGFIKRLQNFDHYAFNYEHLFNSRKITKRPYNLNIAEEVDTKRTVAYSSKTKNNSGYFVYDPTSEKLLEHSCTIVPKSSSTVSSLNQNMDIFFGFPKFQNKLP